MLPLQSFKCSQCNFVTDTSETEAIIDHAYSHTVNQFHLSKERAIALRDFLYRNGYISYEFHPTVIEIVKELDKFLGEENKENNNQGDKK